MTRAEIIEEDLQIIHTAMLVKLEEKNWKPTWENASDVELLGLLKLEVRELQNEIIMGDNEQIIREAADVANFAMMIAGNAMRRI